MENVEQTKITQWKKTLQQGIDTTDLQWLSLRLFLKDLEYKLTVTNGVIHIRHVESGVFISFSRAISLHNCFQILRHNSLQQRAHDNKVLQQVYLQRIKGGIKCNQFHIKFNNVGVMDEVLYTGGIFE